MHADLLTRLDAYVAQMQRDHTGLTITRPDAIRVLLDVPDTDTARAFMEKEPFYSNGVYKDISFHRWRFGRVMDRCK
jgi:hypothetical protein